MPQSDAQQNHRPAKTFRAGRGVQAAIWANEVAQDDRTFTQHSIQIQRRYRDKDGTWQSTDYFRPDDLPRVILAAQKSFEFVSLQESDESPAGAPP